MRHLKRSSVSLALIRLPIQRVGMGLVFKLQNNPTANHLSALFSRQKSIIIGVQA